MRWAASAHRNSPGFDDRRRAWLNTITDGGTAPTAPTTAETSPQWSSDRDDGVPAGSGEVLRPAGSRPPQARPEHSGMQDLRLRLQGLPALGPPHRPRQKDVRGRTAAQAPSGQEGQAGTAHGQARRLRLEGLWLHVRHLPRSPQPGPQAPTGRAALEDHGRRDLDDGLRHHDDPLAAGRPGHLDLSRLLPAVSSPAASAERRPTPEGGDTCRMKLFCSECTRCLSCMGGQERPSSPEIIPLGPGYSMVRCARCKGRGMVCGLWPQPCPG